MGKTSLATTASCVSITKMVPFCPGRSLNFFAEIQKLWEDSSCLEPNTNCSWEEEWKKQAATRINERRKAQKVEEIYCRNVSFTA